MQHQLLKKWKPSTTTNNDGEMKNLILIFLFDLNLVQENGQIRSFSDLAGEALNFHKPG